jgi:hypothetical protein
VFVDVPWRLTWSPLSFIACVAVSCVVVIGRPQACCAPSGGKRDNLLGAGEVAVKAVAIAAQSHTARSIDLFHSALRACVVNKGKWEWVAFTYRAMKEAGFVPVDATHELIVQVCVCVCCATQFCSFVLGAACDVGDVTAAGWSTALCRRAMLWSLPQTERTRTTHCKASACQRLCVSTR